MNKLDDDMIKRLRQSPCGYPDCEKQQLMMCSVPYGQVLESGKLEIHKDMSLTIPLCDYHFHFGRLIVLTDNQIIVPNLKGIKNKNTGEVDNPEDWSDKDLNWWIKDFKKKSKETQGEEKDFFMGWLEILQVIKTAREFTKKDAKHGNNETKQGGFKK